MGSLFRVSLRPIFYVCASCPLSLTKFVVRGSFKQPLLFFLLRPRLERKPSHHLLAEVQNDMGCKNGGEYRAQF